MKNLTLGLNQIIKERVRIGDTILVSWFDSSSDTTERYMQGVVHAVDAGEDLLAADGSWLTNEYRNRERIFLIDRKKTPLPTLLHSFIHVHKFKDADGDIVSLKNPDLARLDNDGDWVLYGEHSDGSSWLKEEDIVTWAPITFTSGELVHV